MILDVACQPKVEQVRKGLIGLATDSKPKGTRPLLTYLYCLIALVYLGRH
jgi:hypothetical protein